jgi:potassium channel
MLQKSTEYKKLALQYSVLLFTNVLQHISCVQDVLQKGAFFRTQLQNGANIVRSQNSWPAVEPAPNMPCRPEPKQRVVIYDHFPVGDAADNPQKRAGGKLVCLPDSLQELMNVAKEKFGKTVRKVFTMDGAEVDDIAVLRDGDHLVLCL